MSEYTGDITKTGLNSIVETSIRLLTGKFNIADIETLCIIFNTEQFEMLMRSMEEARSGQIVNIQEAFEDLN